MTFTENENKFHMIMKNHPLYNVDHWLVCYILLSKSTGLVLRIVFATFEYFFEKLKKIPQNFAWWLRFFFIVKKIKLLKNEIPLINDSVSKQIQSMGFSVTNFQDIPVWISSISLLIDTHFDSILLKKMIHKNI